MNEKKLLVSAIKNGTVIDHIQAGNALKLIRMLNLASHKNIVTVGLNLPSKQMKYKDIIKVAGRILTDEEAGKIAIVAPKASINLIKNYTITKKYRVAIPDSVTNVIICPNSRCITNNELMATRFLVKELAKEIQLQCAYCEKVFKQEEIKEYRV